MATKKFQQIHEKILIKGKGPKMRKYEWPKIRVWPNGSSTLRAKFEAK